LQKNDECGSSFGSIDNNATNNEPLLFGGGIHSSNIADDGSDATTKPSFCRRSSFTDHHFVMTAHLFEEGLLNDNDNAGGCTVINVASITHRPPKSIAAKMAKPPTTPNNQRLDSISPTSIPNWSMASVKRTLGENSPTLCLRKNYKIGRI
jgi:hypothetical protein